MTASADVVARRRELRAAFCRVKQGQGWTLREVPVYTAHAVFRHGWAVGHVVGTADGWWWGVQVRPRVMGSLTRADSADAACVNLRRAVFVWYWEVTNAQRKAVSEDGGIFPGTLAAGATMSDT